MNPLKWIKGKYLQQLAAKSRRHLIHGPLLETVDPENFGDSLRNPTDYYRRSFQDFHSSAPQALKDHRAYFSQDRRGFGEDAFHTMWWRLVKEFKPSTFLEIGVYRGQVLSLISLLGKLEGSPITVTGISPFSSAGDSVSRYLSELDYQKDTLLHFKHHGLPAPTLLKAFSTDEIALQTIAATSWDMIYIDGNHDYNVVLSDWAACSKALKVGGLVVLDDSGLTTKYQPPPFATAGHPGPSQLASEIDPKQFREILQVGHNRVFQKIA